MAVEVQLADGRRDLVIAADVENPMGLISGWDGRAVMISKDTDIRFKGELCWVRWDADGQVSRIVICQGQTISTETVTIGLKVKTDFIEVHFDDNRAKVVAGPKDNVAYIKIDNRSVWDR